jgi:hypothetical protein
MEFTRDGAIARENVWLDPAAILQQLPKDSDRDPHDRGRGNNALQPETPQTARSAQGGHTSDEAGPQADP